MQSSKLYVGNLSYAVTSDALRDLFSTFGQVASVNIIDGKGFGFVEMSSEAEAAKVKDSLNGTEFQGRTLKIDEARPQKSRQDRGFSRY
jgi:RNA recognition motif-containing protein